MAPLLQDPNSDRSLVRGHSVTSSVDCATASAGVIKCFSQCEGNTCGPTHALEKLRTPADSPPHRMGGCLCVASRWGVRPPCNLQKKEWCTGCAVHHQVWPAVSVCVEPFGVMVMSHSCFPGQGKQMAQGFEVENPTTVNPVNPFPYPSLFWQQDPLFAGSKPHSCSVPGRRQLVPAKLPKHNTQSPYCSHPASLDCVKFMPHANFCSFNVASFCRHVHRQALCSHRRDRCAICADS